MFYQMSDRLTILLFPHLHYVIGYKYEANLIQWFLDIILDFLPLPLIIGLVLLHQINAFFTLK